MLGSADEQKEAKPDTVEAWGRASDNFVGGWYGLRKGLRGRFGNYVPQVMEVLGLAEVEQGPRQSHEGDPLTKRFHVERQIRAPAERIWALLTDASSYAAWNPAVISIEGPVREGETISLVSIVAPKRTFKLKVAEMSPPNRMVWSDGMPLGLFRGVRTYLVREQDGVSTYAMTEEFSGPLAGLMSKVIPDMTDSFAQFADGLKRAAEA